MKKETDRKA